MLERKQQERRILVHKELTELQARFLDALFGPAKGNQAKAMKMSGYSENTNPDHIVSSLRSEIIERAELELAGNAPKAAVAMVTGIDDPTQLGIRDKMTAAKELLDRAGLVKTEKMQVESTGGVMLLPPKNEN